MCSISEKRPKAEKAIQLCYSFEVGTFCTLAKPKIDVEAELDRVSRRTVSVGCVAVAVRWMNLLDVDFFSTQQPNLHHNAQLKCVAPLAT